MKILWTVNLIPGEAARALGQNSVVLGGWVESMANQIRNMPDMELAIACKCGTDQQFNIEANGVRYYSLPYSAKTELKELKVGTWEYLQKNKSSKNTVISYGPDVLKLQEQLKDKNINIINARYIKPIDKNILKELIRTKQKIYIYETNIKTNSLGTNILEYFNHKEAKNKVKLTGIDNKYIYHGTIKDLKKKNNLDIDYIVNDILEYFNLKKD